jgi:AcrR family transcriptional regulator
VARSARVDPALVLHFFGSKDELFLAAMKLPLDPSRVLPELIAPGIDGLGERLVRRFIEIWDSPEGRHLVGFVRSVASHDSAATMMREFFTHAVLERIAALLHIDDPHRRASLIASQLFGLALARYVVKLDPVASATADDLARWIGPTVQRYLTAELR